MDYREMYEAAKAGGKIQRQTSRIHSWKEEGENIIGKVIAIIPFEGGSYDKVVNSYLIDVGDSLITTILGSHTDSQLEGVELVGGLISITYDGKKELDGDKKVNLFTIDIVPKAEVYQEPKKGSKKGIKDNG